MVPASPKRWRRRWYKQILTPTTITIKQTHLVKENMMGIRDEWASLQHTHSIGKNNEHLFVHSLPKFPFPLPRIPFLALPINSFFFEYLYPISLHFMIIFLFRFCWRIFGVRFILRTQREKMENIHIVVVINIVRRKYILFISAEKNNYIEHKFKDIHCWETKQKYSLYIPKHSIYTYTNYTYTVSLENQHTLSLERLQNTLVYIG